MTTAGLSGITAGSSGICTVGKEGIGLTYRGYTITDLAENSTFEEVAYLILNKDLPNSIELKKFEKEERTNRELSKNLYEIIKHMPKKSQIGRAHV